MSQAKQDWLAEVARVARSVLYDYRAEHAEPDYAALGEWFATHIVEQESLSPQSFDDMYDYLHRGGSNS